MGNCLGSDAANGGNAPSGANPSAPKTSFKQTYQLGDILGEGAFSVVKLAIHKQTKQKVAVKIINKSGLSEVDELSLRQEVAILKDLKHPNIVGLVGMYLIVMLCVLYCFTKYLISYVVQLVGYYEEPKEFMIALEFLRKFKSMYTF